MYMILEHVVILMLFAFIMGLFTGVAMIRPRR